MLIILSLFTLVICDISLGKPRYVLVGDSRMKRTFEQIIRLESGCQETKVGDRCNGNLRYYGIDPNTYTRFYHQKDFNDKDVSIGPYLFGLDHLGCMDCSGCWPRYYTCQNIDFEFLGIEFSKDIEVQIQPYFNYTQEVIYKHYLSKNYDALIVNVGLHDMYKMIPAVFKKNLNWMLTLIKENQMENSHSRFIWVTIMAVDEQKVPSHFKKFTNNANVNIFNNISTSLAKEFGFEIFDAYKLSIHHQYKTTYEDDVHPSVEFFKNLSHSLVEYLSLHS